MIEDGQRPGLRAMLQTIKDGQRPELNAILKQLKKVKDWSQEPCQVNNGNARVCFYSTV